LPKGKWVGKGAWQTNRHLANFTATVVADGTVFGKVRLRYAFEGQGGLFSEAPATVQVDVTLGPSRAHAVIEETLAMGRDEWWEFDCAAGWAPRRAVVKPHFGGFGRPEMKDPQGNPYPFPPQSLAVGQTRMHDTLLNLIPRWSQAYDDGWLFLVCDQANALGAIVCRAGKWLWPYDNMMEIKVKESADYAGLRCPTWRGKRYWYLVAGPRQDWENVQATALYLVRHACEGLDKLHHEYILDWPGLQPPPDANVPPEEAAQWGSGAGRFPTRTNPFVGWGPGGNPGFQGKDHPISTLIRQQVIFDPDTFGNYWLFFSPENPNFATSWLGPGFWPLKNLTGHPRFKDLAKFAEMKFREDLYHSFTLPGGAGQECPGYMTVGSQHGRAKFFKELLGCDPLEWPWIRAAVSFWLHASHPMADGGRRSHPGGDTHPPGPDVFGPQAWVGLKEDVTTFKTEELPGFGVIFRNRPGTPEETYLAFKSGPNRGHFHGDQLSFHYCPYGRPQIVDHHCSYGPRAGQEHMHNRVAFHTEQLPYANMDGFERVLAFKTSPQADVAMGQVESERLRITVPFPPEKWDWDLPQQRFDKLLKYRRTIVLVKGAERDCFVIRDQYAGPELNSTYCLHVYGETCAQDKQTFDFDAVRLFVAKPEDFQVSRHDWAHENGGHEETKGLRLTVKGSASEFITVLMPKPLKRCDVAKLTLKDGAVRDERGKGDRQPVWRKGDLVALLTWEDGKLREQARFRTPTLDSRLSCGGAVKEVSAEGQLQFQLAADLFVKGKGSQAEHTVTAKREGKVFAGTYEGAVAGQKLSGEVTGEWLENALPPFSIFVPAALPAMAAIPGGVRVGEDEIVFSGGIDDDDGATYVSVTRGGKEVLALTGKDIDMDRSQGEIGLCVPDAGYPFGVIPDWLIRQRCKKPSWYVECWPLAAEPR
jgi:hypothetical protein